MRCFIVILLFLLTPQALASYASWYGEEYRGCLMANGRPFDPDRLTCASWFHPIGTRLEVLHAQSGRSVVVTVTDRGPHRRLVRSGRVIDLSEAAYRRLASLDSGLCEVRLRVLRSQLTRERSRR